MTKPKFEMSLKELRKLFDRVEGVRGRGSVEDTYLELVAFGLWRLIQMQDVESVGGRPDFKLP